MFKKFAIPGLVLLLAGSTALGWTLLEKKKERQKAAYYKSKYGTEPDVYIRQYTEWLQLPPEQRVYMPWGLDKNGKPKTESQIQQEQQERLKADLEKLASGKTDTAPFADVLYGANWKEELKKYKKTKARRETVFTGSILCMFAGGSILTCGLLYWLGQKLAKTSSPLGKLVAPLFKKQDENEAKQSNGPKVATAPIFNPADERWLRNIVRKKTQLKENAENEAKEKDKSQEKTKSDTQEMASLEKNAAKETKSPAQKQESQPKPEKDKKNSQGLVNSGFKKVMDSADKKDEKTPSQETHSEKTKVGVKNLANKAGKSSGLHSNIKNSEIVKSLDNEKGNADAGLNLKDSLKAQTENLEKQMAEFRQMAKGVQQTAIDHSQPINSTLNELTQQVSAIREYASSQQDRLKKLQDGYDWNIMRTFCLRFIRCIDNLDKRISEMADQGDDVIKLKEVRDELLFALESSGVEQFEPEVNSDYHGQEKYAEAVKEKENCKDKKRAGKIAKVIRPAYQYFIDDENAKIVRPAQVKLYG
jgi:chemotaxis protein histidine kinase CheA